MASSGTHRALVLDANILIRGVLGRRVRSLLEQHAPQVDFLAPDIAFTEAARYLPEILARRDHDPGLAISTLDYLREFVRVVELPIYEPFRTLARERLQGQDPDDWPVLACALALDCPIWTEDRDFFGVGVPTWKTARVEIFLSPAGA